MPRLAPSVTPRLSWFASAMLLLASPALAQDADTDVEEPPPTDDIAVAPTEGPRLVCRVFTVDLRDPQTLDTSDGTTEIGQWVASQAAEGLTLYNVDFEVGQKATGYPQGYAYVCLYPG